MVLIGDWFDLDNDNDNEDNSDSDEEIEQQYQMGCQLFGEEAYIASIQKFTSNVHQQCRDRIEEELLLNNDPEINDVTTWLVDQPTLLKYRYLRWDPQGLLDREHDLIELIRIDPKRFRELLGDRPVRCKDIVIDDLLGDRSRKFVWDRGFLNRNLNLTSEDRRWIDLLHRNPGIRMENLTIGRDLTILTR